MAFTQALPRSVSRTIAADELAGILAGPLPDLPPGETAEVAAELRRMQTARAVAVWRHPGWAAVVGWIVGRVPDCDPTIAAVHAVRNGQTAAQDPRYARSLAAYVRQIAHHSPLEARPKVRRVQELTWDPPEPAVTEERPEMSLVDDANELLSAAGITPTERSGSLIAASVDIAVDWWDGFASRTGLVGHELVVASRQSPRVTGTQRLRANFDGPTARPLVALLVGGDQRGRWARQAAGTEAGLLYWSLLIRHSRDRCESAPLPPTPVRRAWATHVEWIDRAITSAGPATVPTIGPTVAA